MSLSIEAVHQIDPTQVGDLISADPNEEVNRLTNDVHPLWAYRNWSRDVRWQRLHRIERKELHKKPLTKGVCRARCKPLPTHTFERLLPALRLASLFLERSLPWFWNLRYAPYQRFGKKNHTELILDDGEWTQQKDDQIRRDFDIVAQRYFLLSGTYGWELGATGMTSWSSMNLDNDDPADPALLPEDAPHLITVLAKEAFDFIGSQQWLTLPLAMRHRCLFLIATLLLHELAHVVIYYRGDHDFRIQEPYFRQTEPAREAGFSWEYYMFGGIFAMVDGDFTGNKPLLAMEGMPPFLSWRHEFHSHVLMFLEWKRGRHSIGNLKDPPARWLVASQSIDRLFDTRFWRYWLAMPVRHGTMAPGPMVLHLSPSLFTSHLHENSMAFDIWFRRRLHQAAGQVGPEVTDDDSQESALAYSSPVSSPMSSADELDSASLGDIMDTS